MESCWATKGPGALAHSTDDPSDLTLSERSQTQDHTPWDFMYASAASLLAAAQVFCAFSKNVLELTMLMVAWACKYIQTTEVHTFDGGIPWYVNHISTDYRYMYDERSTHWGKGARPAGDPPEDAPPTPPAAHRDRLRAHR